MRKSFILFSIFFSVLLSFTIVAQDNSTESVLRGTSSTINIVNPTGWVYESPAAVLYDNGAYFNSPGGGPGGADGSVLENVTLGMTSLGAGHQVVNLNRVADDFVIPSGETWTINTASFYAYQTGSTTTSTITSVNVRIWDGPPGVVGSSIIFGDSTTNVMSSTEFTNCYRYSENSVGTTRPIMKQTVNIGTTLTEGTYWIDWQSGGTLASGPWAPPIAILGQNTTGNARQGLAGVWANLVDGGTLTPQGLPFILDGTAGNPPVFFDNFDTYTAGNLVACSNPTFWTTWSNAPCGAEDALVSSDFAFSGTNSAKIIQNDDLVKDFGTAYTSGKYKISVQVYIPATKAGYLNTLATFGATNNWAMEMYFDATGSGRINPDGAVPATFSWTADQWNLVEHVIDLDANLGEIYFNGVLVQSQQYTLGAYTTVIPLSLEANDFYGATANDNMYLDDYSVEDLTVVPVELTSFSANSANGKINLNWTTATELNNQGFEIQRRTVEGQYNAIGFVAGNGTTSETKQYSYSDAPEVGEYYYRLKQIDFDGTFEYSNEVFGSITTPLEFALNQNYPNPFNPTTNITFTLAEPSFVKLAIYNTLGEEVKVLKNESMNAGSYNISFDAVSFPSGMYLYKIETAQFTSVRKMMLLK